MSQMSAMSGADGMMDPSCDPSSPNSPNSSSHHGYSGHSGYDHDYVDIQDVPLGKPIEEVYEGVHDGPVLGSGISGIVRLVKHRTTQVSYAVKCLDLALIDSEEGLKQLKEEIYIMCQLDHPNIVRLEEVYESHSEIYLVQEVCLGGELFDRLDAQPDFHYTESQCAKLVKQMLSSVRYIHNKGIIHRDLKLENFLFENERAESELKMIDFGLSKHFTFGEVHHDAVGTPYTVAPEVIKGAYDERCDVWAIGVITFLLLSGDPPFGGCGGPETLMQVRDNILRGAFAFEPAEIWDGVSEEAKEFIRSLLVIDPLKRPTARMAKESQWLKMWADKENVNQEDKKINPNVVKALVNFKEYSDMRKLLCEVLSFTLLPEQIQDLRKEFEKYDQEGTGEITLDTLKKVLIGNAATGSLGGLTEVEVEDIFNAMRVRKGETSIHWHDFIAAGLSQCKVDERNLRLAFERLDQEHKGYITFENVMDLMGNDTFEKEDAMLKMWRDSMQDVDCKTALVTYEDFLLLMKGQKRETLEKQQQQQAMEAQQMQLELEAQQQAQVQAQMEVQQQQSSRFLRGSLQGVQGLNSVPEGVVVDSTVEEEIHTPIASTQDSVLLKIPSLPLESPDLDLPLTNEGGGTQVPQATQQGLAPSAAAASGGIGAALSNAENVAKVSPDAVKLSPEEATKQHEAISLPPISSLQTPPQQQKQEVQISQVSPDSTGTPTREFIRQGSSSAPPTPLHYGKRFDAIEQVVESPMSAEAGMAGIAGGGGAPGGILTMANLQSLSGTGIATNANPEGGRVSFNDRPSVFSIPNLDIGNNLNNSDGNLNVSNLDLTPPQTPVRGPADYVTPTAQRASFNPALLSSLAPPDLSINNANASNASNAMSVMRAPSSPAVLGSSPPSLSALYRGRSISLDEQDRFRYSPRQIEEDVITGGSFGALGSTPPDRRSMMFKRDSRRALPIPEHTHNLSDIDKVISDESKTPLVVNRKLYRAHREFRHAVVDACKRFEDEQLRRAKETLRAQEDGKGGNGRKHIAGLVMRHGSRLSEQSIKTFLKQSLEEQQQRVDDANRRGGRGRRSRKKTISDMSGMLAGSSGDSIGAGGNGGNGRARSRGARSTLAAPTVTANADDRRAKQTLAALQSGQDPTMASNINVKNDTEPNKSLSSVKENENLLRNPTKPGEFRKTKYDPFQRTPILMPKMPMTPNINSRGHFVLGGMQGSNGLRGMNGMEGIPQMPLPLTGNTTNNSNTSPLNTPRTPTLQPLSSSFSARTMNSTNSMNTPSYTTSLSSSSLLHPSSAPADTSGINNGPPTLPLTAMGIMTSSSGDALSGKGTAGIGGGGVEAATEGEQKSQAVQMTQPPPPPL